MLTLDRMANALLLLGITKPATTEVQMAASSIMYNLEHKQLSRLCSQETRACLKTVEKENTIHLNS